MEDLNIDKMPNLYEILNRLIEDIIQKVPASTRPDSVDIDINLSSIILKFNLNIRAASIIYGTKGPRKFPPPDAIKGWILKNNINPRANANGKLPSIDQLAFLIGRKISREGTPPHSYYSDAVNEILDFYGPQIEQSLEKDFISILGLDTLL